MTELTLKLGWGGDLPLHLEWIDENGLLQKARLDFRMKLQDKPRVLEVLHLGCVLLSMPNPSHISIDNPVQVFPDGNQWCARIGEDLIVGHGEFADTPQEAVEKLSRYLGLPRLGDGE